MDIILASGSLYRKQLFEQLGVEFRVEVSQVDEAPIQNDKNLEISKKASLLAELKAKAVFESNPKSLVIGSDQVAQLEQATLGKPGTKEKAIEQLLSMSGKTHFLHTAVTLFAPGHKSSFLNTTKLKMRELTPAQIENYIDRDEPLDCAGSYKLEKSGITLFESIETSDHTAIIGLPLIELTSNLIALGLSIP